MLGPTQMLAFRRLGKKVAVIFENPRFRATGEAAVQNGAKTSFLQHGGHARHRGERRQGHHGGHRPFLTRDTMGLAEALNREAKGFRPWRAFRG
jgi:hypothetical protein